MLKLTDYINSASALAQQTPSSQFAMHALKRDADGKLTYTKSLFANTAETIEMTDGTGFAYMGLEELIRGTTDSGVSHNSTPITQSEVSDKNAVSKTIYVRVNNGGYDFDISGNPATVGTGNTNIELEVTRGATYTFIMTDPSTQGYPLYISKNSAGGNYADEFLVGVENSRSAYGGSNGDLNTESEGPLVFTIPEDAPDILYYASGNHANVYGMMRVRRENANLTHRKHEQVRFDGLQLSYYINNRGFLVARYLNEYDYSVGPA
jgi:hypothetical protein